MLSMGDYRAEGGTYLKLHPFPSEKGLPSLLHVQEKVIFLVGIFPGVLGRGVPHPPQKKKCKKGIFVFKFWGLRGLWGLTGLCFQDNDPGQIFSDNSLRQPELKSNPSTRVLCKSHHTGRCFAIVIILAIA